MDFYLPALCFLTDLAVNAKSCLNSNKKSLSPLCVTTTMKGILNSIDIVYFPTLANA